MIMATAIISDLSIAGHDRWETNEKAQASRHMEYSVWRRVSAWPWRLPTTTSGQVQRTLLRTRGTRTSTLATRVTRTTTIRRMRTMFVRLGGRIKYEI